jgi:hypothetical protein
MRAILLSKTAFDSKREQLGILTRDWSDRECVSFDQAVRRAAGHGEGAGSIWQMPTIDSKCVVSLLVELEPLLGCKLPSSLIMRGGYPTPQELEKDLIARIRERCTDDPIPVAASVSEE